MLEVNLSKSGFTDREQVCFHWCPIVTQLYLVHESFCDYKTREVWELITWLKVASQTQLKKKKGGSSPHGSAQSSETRPPIRVQ